jgi:hypothetical protein
MQIFGMAAQLQKLLLVVRALNKTLIKLPQPPNLLFSLSK